MTANLRMRQGPTKSGERCAALSAGPEEPLFGPDPCGSL